MKSQRFGIEIEMTGLTRRSAALIIAKHFDTGFRHERGVYDTYSVCDQDGRKWKIVRDASITPQCGNRFDYDPDYKVEVVSPICHYEDIETIQSIVREGMVMLKSMKAVEFTFMWMLQNTLPDH